MDFCRYCFKHWLLIRCLLGLILSPVPVQAARLQDGHVPVVAVSAQVEAAAALSEPPVNGTDADSSSTGPRIYRWRDRTGHMQFSHQPPEYAGPKSYQADYASAAVPSAKPVPLVKPDSHRKSKTKTGKSGRSPESAPAAYISSSRLSARCIWLQGRMRSLGNLRELDPDSRLGLELERWRADWRNERCLKGGNFFNRKADIEARTIKVKAKP